MDVWRNRPFLKNLTAIGFVTVFLFAAVWWISSIVVNDGGGDFTQRNKLAIIRVEGVIAESEDIIRQIKKYREEPAVKGIILRIDSPGGGVGPSQEIYGEVLKTTSEKKVVVSMGGLAASGGYYIACAAHRIFANPGTITGSIGVIMAFSNFEELMKKLGLKTTVIKSGRHKDIGSPVRELTEEEKKILQDVSDDIHGQFIEAVAKGRNLKIEAVKDLSDGRIFSGRQAKESGLVDELGTLEDAVSYAAKLAGIKGKPKIIQERKEKNLLLRLFKENLSSFIPSPLDTKFLGAQYLWQY
ncbi:MAG: signal peptide peptidase SppA [Nitrospinae bacterium]|nr:signal peptide peptidase SppA [Nitrospinota bacterium]MBI3812903.1 signal peptide peptidase SppA [Nitrospinota bacterium]